MKTYAKLLLTALFWGGAFIAGRQVSQNLGPFTIAFLRFALASILLAGLVWKQEGRVRLPDRALILPLLLLGVTGIFTYNVLFFSGLKLVEAGRASLIIAISPAFIALASVVFFKERLSLIRTVGIPLSILGAAIVISKGDLLRISARHVGVGELYLLGCVFSWVIYSLVGKTVMRRISPLAAVFYSTVVGTVLLAVSASFNGLTGDIGRMSALDGVSIGYMALFATVMGFVWFYEGVKAVGPTRAGLFINFVPVSSVLLAFLILHEPITWSLVAGAVCVLSGVYLTNRSDRAREAGVTHATGTRATDGRPH